MNKSRFFHVVGGLPADAMHDVLEGVLQYGVKELIKVYINEQKLFTLDELNKRIAECDYGYHNDANRPAQITQKKLASADNGLRQHGSRMVNFILQEQLLLCYVTSYYLLSLFLM